MRSKDTFGPQDDTNVASAIIGVARLPKKPGLIKLHSCRSCETLTQHCGKKCKAEHLMGGLRQAPEAAAEKARRPLACCFSGSMFRVLNEHGTLVFIAIFPCSSQHHKLLGHLQSRGVQEAAATLAWKPLSHHCTVNFSAAVVLKQTGCVESSQSVKG